MENLKHYSVLLLKTKIKGAMLTEAIFSIVMTSISTTIIMSLFYFAFKNDILFDKTFKKSVFIIVLAATM